MGATSSVRDDLGLNVEEVSKEGTQWKGRGFWRDGGNKLEEGGAGKGRAQSRLDV